MNESSHLDKLPVFMRDSKTFEILVEAKSAVPTNAKAYLVGGAIRNALFFKIFNEHLPQRDYDVLLIGDKDAFVKNLRSCGFVYGKIRRKNEVVVKKKKMPRPMHEHRDYVFLDIHVSAMKGVLKNLRSNSNFTINGFALPLEYIDSKNWDRKIISLPRAMRDLRHKELRVNIIAHPANLFACLRFMSKGFKPPSNKETRELLHALGSLEKWRFKRNVRKLFDYVGGEKAARKLVKTLGIRTDIFDFKAIKKLRAKK